MLGLYWVTPCHGLNTQEWRGEHFACTTSEYQQVKRQLMAETHAPAPGKGDDGEGSSGGRSWQELSSEEQNKLLKARLKKYCQKVSMLNGRLHQSWLVELLSCSAGAICLGRIQLIVVC